MIAFDDFDTSIQVEEIYNDYESDYYDSSDEHFDEGDDSYYENDYNEGSDVDNWEENQVFLDQDY